MNPANSQEALAQLQQAQSSAQNPNQILEAQRQGLGVQGAQDTVTGLRGAINNTTKLLKQVAPSVMGRTANSLVTNAQATRQISNEQAPISQNLSEQGTEYNQASQDLGQLQDRAREASSGIYQGQQDKLSYAQNLYNTLYQREESAKQAAAAEADRQEQVRQFNEQLAASKAKSAGNNFNMGGNSTTSSSMAKRSDGGFNFTDSGGKAISAAQYAQSKGIAFRDLLSEMAKQGDQGAKTALGFVGNDFGYDPRKLVNGVSSPGLINLYKSLVWQ